MEENEEKFITEVEIPLEHIRCPKVYHRSKQATWLFR